MINVTRLKRIKNELRATISQERLSALSILCMESDKLRRKKFHELLDDFGMKKARKITFLISMVVASSSLKAKCGTYQVSHKTSF